MKLNYYQCPHCHEKTYAPPEKPIMFCWTCGKPNQIELKNAQKPKAEPEKHGPAFWDEALKTLIKEEKAK